MQVNHFDKSNKVLLIKKNLKLIHHMDLYRENMELHKVYLEEEFVFKAERFLVW